VTEGRCIPCTQDLNPNTATHNLPFDDLRVLRSTSPINSLDFNWGPKLPRSERTRDPGRQIPTAVLHPWKRQ
jgi:hypothetical protein